MQRTDTALHWTDAFRLAFAGQFGKPGHGLDKTSQPALMRPLRHYSIRDTRR
jgi:hypothetical protein